MQRRNEVGGYIGIILAVVIGTGLAAWGISTLLPDLDWPATDEDNWWDQ
jgi:hypothetical protein